MAARSRTSRAAPISARPRAEIVLGTLAEAGFSDTGARRAVVMALCEAESGATPADLLERGRASHARLGQVTVYRTLEILERLGLSRKLHQEDGCSTYAVSSRGHAHHVICRTCHKVAEYEGCSIDKALRDAAARTGYLVEGHWLEMFGLCPSCRGKK
ncbi:MAG: Fur family transcriptional regulator [Spirochaetia bacterium]